MEYSIPAIEQLLRDYPHIFTIIEQKQKELDEILSKKNALYGVIKAAILTGMPPSGQLSDPTYQTTIKIIDGYQKEIDRLFNEIKTLFDNHLTVKTLLNGLTKEEKFIIEARYFKQPPTHWSIIARQLHYHRVTCNDIRIRALKKMAKIKTPA